jgi:hypothetical protein
VVAVAAVLTESKTPLESLTGPLAAELVLVYKATDYSTFKFKFEIGVTMPSDTILTGTTVSATIEDSASNQVWATSNTVSDFLAPSRPSGMAAANAGALVSFGKDPAAAAE